MTKPVFGKWTRVEDALPDFEKQAGEIEFVFVLALQKVGRVSEMEYNSKGEWRVCGCPVHEDNITYWMPLPKAGEDAFTELRAKLDALESRYETDLVNLEFDVSMGMSQYNLIKKSCAQTGLNLIKEIREVIE
jgi:hypothetical protein